MCPNFDILNSLFFGKNKQKQNIAKHFEKSNLLKKEKKERKVLLLVQHKPGGPGPTQAFFFLRVTKIAIVRFIGWPTEYCFTATT